jgi:OOP family OmpA-OmpF porin
VPACKHHTYNLELSERRAASVVAYLVERGVDAGRLQAVGKGETDPAADNTTEAGRHQNRRVVIRLQE